MIAEDAGPEIGKNAGGIGFRNVLISKEIRIMRNTASGRILLGATALCLLLVNAGCNGTATSSLQSGVTPADASIRSDWGETLTAGGTVGIGMFPAKFTFDVNAAPDCTNDFVAFNTSLAGVSPTAAATQVTGDTFAATGTPAGTFTITETKDDTVSLVLTAAADNTGNDFLVIANTGSGAAANAASLAARITVLGAGIDVKATSVGAVVTVTALFKGSSGNNITVASTLTNFTVGSAALTGGTGLANIVAFNQLYAPQGSTGGLCNQNGVSHYWSYFTGTGSAVTSAVLSGDGTKVAFVENVGTNAVLRILQWKTGEGSEVGFPVAPTLTLTTGTSWASGCPPVSGGGSSCLSSISFSGTAAVDTKSSPFYVYNQDTLYVGDNSGRVHKFTGVFNGTPAEVTTSWPITVHSGFILTSAIYESISGNIFVGDSNGRLSFIQEVGSTVGGATPCSPTPCLNSVNLAVGTGGAIVDAPIVDGTTGMVFAVNGTETSHNGVLVQGNTGLVAQTGSPWNIGGSGAGSALYSGAFDQAYFSSTIPTIAGHMYVCGKGNANIDRPAIYQLSFTPATGVVSGVGTALTGLVSASNEACSPVTEFYNPNGAGTGVARDWIFFSIGNRAANAAPMPVGGACGTANAGCVISINVTGNPTWPPAAVTSTAPLPLNATGASSGIVVDNTSISSQASSFYFTLGANSTGVGPGLPSCNTTAGLGCAVKLTQSGLL